MHIYIAALLVLIVVLFAHILGIESLYYTVEVYDVFMHFLGGVGIALFVVALLRSYRDGALFSAKNLLVSVIIVGIVWEIFEIAFGLTGHPVGSRLYTIDTIQDLIMDTLGGVSVALICKKGKRAGLAEESRVGSAGLEGKAE